MCWSPCRLQWRGWWLVAGQGRGVTIIEWQLGWCWCWCCAVLVPPDNGDNCELSIIGTPCLSSDPRGPHHHPWSPHRAALSMVRSQLVRVHIVLTRIRHSAPSIWCSSSLPANDIWQLDPDLDFEPNTRYLFSQQYLKNRKKICFCTAFIL